MGTPRVAIVADDLTGAADTAVTFARRGLATLMVLGGGALPAADTLALSTESRQLDGTAAARKVVAAARRLAAARLPGDAILYKKIDSTLRGNPGVELDALMTALGVDAALVAPAFPAQGRTTVDGRQRVDGQPLEETTFAADVATSRLDDVFHDFGRPCVPLDLATVRAGAGALQADLARAGASVLLADAETDGDLAALVAGARGAGLRLFCGSAGLAAALATAMPAASSGEPDLPPPTGAPILVVAASRNPRTLAQVERLRQADIPVLVPPSTYFLDEDADARPLAEAAAALLARHRALVVTTSGLPDLPRDPFHVVRRLAGLVRLVTADVGLGGLVLTGGDVAYAVCEALGIMTVRLRGEIEPGMPWSTPESGTLPTIPIVTRAGGFGDQDSLLTVLRRLSAPR